jgi:transcriptional regulator of acetoin/glycerol metabolism
MIKRLERAEADIQVVRTTTSDLKNQYRSGRIARELYESLVSDLVRRKEKAQQTMDTIVINLREETR